MSRYIEFASDPSDPGLLGNPVYSGVPDARIEFDGIRVNGEEITFLRDGVVEDVHRSLIDGRELIGNNGEGFDCVAFASLMNGVDLVSATNRRTFEVDSGIDDQVEITDDTSQDFPLTIGAWPRMCKEPYYYHTITPAHTTEGPLYLHKLGDEDPICISGIREAQNIVGGTRLARVSSMTVYVKEHVVAEWRYDEQTDKSSETPPK